MTKILATLGPASLNKKTVLSLTNLGVDLFRINLSHTPLNDLENNIRLIQSWTNVPICLDSEGAQLRNGLMVNENIIFKAGDKVKINRKNIVGDNQNISFNPENITDQFEVNDEIQVDFNNVKLKIISKDNNELIALVKTGGKIGSNKAADLNRDLQFEPLTQKDKAAIKIGLDNNINNFAMSFADRPENVDLMRNICGRQSKIICKIESKLGVRNLEGIIERTNAILIDRGDLSRQIAIEKIPFLQRKIISTSRYKGTPVYVATNLLETMIKTNSPTRAEVNDVVSTLEMGASGLVLAAETAIGNYPIQSVKMIKKLIKEYNKWTPNMSFTDLLNS